MCVCVCEFIDKLADIHTYILSYIHTYTHICIHTYLHTNILHTRIYMNCFFCMCIYGDGPVDAKYGHTRMRAYMHICKYT